MFGILECVYNFFGSLFKQSECFKLNHELNKTT